MCFNLTSNGQKPITATHDIRVHKTEGRAWWLFFWPQYQRFTYLRGKKTKKIDIKVKSVLGGGPHEWYFGEINKGYHFYNHVGLGRIWNCRLYNTPIVYEFIIPAGTKYYENETEIVAEQTVYIGTVKPSNDWIKRCVNEYRNSIMYLEHEPGDS